MSGNTPDMECLWPHRWGPWFIWDLQSTSMPARTDSEKNLTSSTLEILQKFHNQKVGKSFGSDPHTTGGHGPLKIISWTQCSGFTGFNGFLITWIFGWLGRHHSDRMFPCAKVPLSTSWIFWLRFWMLSKCLKCFPCLLPFLTTV